MAKVAAVFKFNNGSNSNNKINMRGHRRSSSRGNNNKQDDLDIPLRQQKIDRERLQQQQQQQQRMLQIKTTTTTKQQQLKNNKNSISNNNVVVPQHHHHHHHQPQEQTQQHLAVAVIPGNNNSSHSVSTTTTATTATATATKTTDVMPPPQQPRFRTRSISDGVVHAMNQIDASRDPPQDPYIITTQPLPVVGEHKEVVLLDHGATAASRTSSTSSLYQHQPSSASSGNILPPPSPGTPPRKLWERQYGSFLRNRLGGNKSGRGSTAPSIPLTPTITTGTTQHNRRGSNGSGSYSSTTSTTNPPIILATEPNISSSKRETSVRGGKFFSNVFRSTSSSSNNSGGGDISTPSSNISRKVKSTDELDGTLRRGAEKAYSPRNQRYYKEDYVCVVEPVIHSPSTESLTRAADFTIKSSLMNQASSSGGGATIAPPPPPPPPVLLAPRNPQSASASPSSDIFISSKSSSSSAMKKAFTDFHNSTKDSNSAYLGDEPSNLAGNIYWAQKNEKLLVDTTGMMSPSRSQGHLHNSILPGAAPSDNNNNMAIATAASLTAPNSSGRRRYETSISSSYHSPLDTGAGDDAVKIAKSMRILKPINGVETWQSGRRYLIAPAVLSACPITAISTLFGNSINQSQCAEKAAFGIKNNLLSPFGMIILGECLLTYVNTTDTSNKKSRVVKQWALAKLVLRQNYLLEYDADVDVKTAIPRGCAHLQYATTKNHEHFTDTLELHFYGSPCAKADKHILMIRIISDPNDNKTSSSLDNSVHLRPEVRESWVTCLNRAASLSKISDLYVYDETDDGSLLGNSQYAHVRAARRREYASSHTNDENNTTPNCALKIFDKNKFWKAVVKGRERADTIVRETSVQATLLAKCGSNNNQRMSSFLQLRGFYETTDFIILELELLDGTDLFEYISSKNVLDETEAATILRDILQCLHAMKRIGLVHRDVKPSNTLMCSTTTSTSTRKGTTSLSPRVKVCDFGMASFVGVDGHIRGRCGTPGYVAPEIFTAGVYGGYGNKVDIFSAGVTLYVMLVGYEPFYGETDDELKEANKKAVIDFPNEDWINISSEAKDLVRKMMNPDPQQRLDAYQALQHPWFSKHLPVEIMNNNDLDKSMSYGNGEVHPSDDACVIS